LVVIWEAPKRSGEQFIPYRPVVDALFVRETEACDLGLRALVTRMIKLNFDIRDCFAGDPFTRTVRPHVGAPRR
jgi:hypothetical protein